eukprot:TRINITY_DN13251_c0_g1_i1.p1 TRINITY_DN13251_c0_g1~~TRINITY_DN13251_c0_g1_i1.p1  ORF type:complete len:145 (+),score=22.00 TRINITY_DN13251_c0_g1_i1:374-808(+)
MRTQKRREQQTDNAEELDKREGTHLLVGVHSDELLKKMSDFPIFEDFETRVSRILQNRHVSSVLRGAPWAISEEFLNALNIKRVTTGTLSKIEDVGSDVHGQDPYQVPRKMGILEVIPSTDETTERSFHEAQITRMMEAEDTFG